MKHILIKAAIPLCLSLAMAKGAYAVSDITDITEIDQSIMAENINTAQINESSAHYIRFSGKIDTVSGEQGVSRISVTDENDETIFFNIHDNTLIYSLNTTEKISFDAFEKGQTVSVFYNVMTPQLLSFPPQIGPEVIIIHDNEIDRFVKVDYFDEDSFSSDELLKLNLSEEMLIFNSAGEVVPFEDTLEKNLLVFYEITTRSLPPQTPPVKVIILDSDVLELGFRDTEINDIEINPESETQEEFDLFDLLEQEDIIVRDGTRFIALYKIAQIKGLNLSWSAETGTVTISNPENSSSFSFVNNSTEYGFNRSLRNFTNAPFIMNDRTYVEEAFIDEIENELVGVKEF